MVRTQVCLRGQGRAGCVCEDGKHDGQREEELCAAVRVGTYGHLLEGRYARQGGAEAGQGGKGQARVGKGRPGWAGSGWVYEEGGSTKQEGELHPAVRGAR